jgi:flagellin-like protein
LKFFKGRRRRAISELVASVLTIAITIMAGAAVFGFVNGQAGVNEKQYGQSVGAVVDQMQERFVVFDLSVGTSSMGIWVYNTGQTDLQLVSIRVYNTTNPSTLNIMYNYTTSGQTKTDYVYDLNGPSSCKNSATSIETPAVSTIDTKITQTGFITLTLPSSQSGCPSYGQSFKSKVTYSVTVLALYGNVETASQVKS